MGWTGWPGAARVAAAALAIAAPLGAQSLNVAALSDEAAGRDLAAAVEIDTLVMMPMRDGVSLASYLFRPKEVKG